MVSKRITVKKTSVGYSITVSVKDKLVFKALHLGIINFFNKIKEQEQNELKEKTL